MLEHIHLKNFKGFINESFELSELTLFAGNNGMGKSTVIQSLLLLKQSFESTKLTVGRKVDLFNQSYVDLESAANLCYRKADPRIVSIEIETSGDKSHKWEIDAAEQTDTQSLKGISVPRAKETELSFNYYGSGNYESEALFRKSFLYLNAERLGPRRKYEKQAPRVFNTRIGIQGELTPAYIYDAIKENRTIGVPALKHPKAHSLDLSDNLNAWISEILGRSITAKFNELSEQEVTISFNVRGTQGGDYSAMQVGFGYSFSLPVILAPLIAEKGDLIIIENPEAHLHPSAQSKITKLLALAAENGIQIILETHSDHVLNSIRVMASGKDSLGSIDSSKIRVHFFYLAREGEEEIQSKRMLKVNSDGSLTGWPTGLFDEWEKSLSTLLR